MPRRIPPAAAAAPPPPYIPERALFLKVLAHTIAHRAAAREFLLTLTHLLGAPAIPRARWDLMQDQRSLATTMSRSAMRGGGQ